VGLPNAGKSTLANALLGRAVSITSESAGTTRDWVDAQVVLTNRNRDVEVPAILVDTAGVRETADAIEREAIARGDRQASAADVVLVLIDGSRPLAPGEKELVVRHQTRPTRVVVAINKMDAANNAPAEALQLWPAALQISAKQHQGLDGLMHALLAALHLDQINTTEAFAFTQRQRQLLEAIAQTQESAAAAESLRILTEGT
jgi:tRNA modification GTPase